MSGGRRWWKPRMIAALGDEFRANFPSSFKGVTGEVIPIITSEDGAESFDSGLDGLITKREAKPGGVVYIEFTVVDREEVYD